MEIGESYDLDALAAISGLDGPELVTKLVDLELRGLVGRSGADRF